MKKYFFLPVVALLFLFSCKKSGDGASNTFMIGEVLTNGYLESEYQYALDKKLVRYNQYNVVASQAKLGLYVLYEYGPDDQISKRKIFTSNDTLNNWYVLSHDNAGRLTRMDWYAFGATVTEYRIYEYDQQNRMSKYTVKNGANNATKGYVEYTYDDQGRLDLQKHYSWDTDKFKLTQEVDYVPAGKNVYNHWQKFMTYAVGLYFFIFIFPGLFRHAPIGIVFIIYIGGKCSRKRTIDRIISSTGNSSLCIQCKHIVVL